MTSLRQQLEALAAMPDTLPVNGTPQTIPVHRDVHMTPAEARALLQTAERSPIQEHVRG